MDIQTKEELKKEAIRDLIKKSPLKPICLRCGCEAILLPHLNTSDLYAFKCGCTIPFGWSYVSTLKQLNPFIGLSS